MRIKCDLCQNTTGFYFMIIALTWTSIQIITSPVACIVMHLLGTDENGTRFVQEDLDRVVSASMCPSNAVLALGLSDTKCTKRMNVSQKPIWQKFLIIEQYSQGSHWHWKTWKNETTFCSQGILKNVKSQGI